MSCRYRDGKPEKFVMGRASRLKAGCTVESLALAGKAYVLLSFIFFARRDDSVQPVRCQGTQPTVACLIQKLNAES